VDFVGFRCLQRLSVQNCYVMRDDPGITPLVSMIHGLKKDFGHEVSIQW